MDGSAPMAAATCPRRSWRRSTSWPRCTTRRGSDPAFWAEFEGSSRDFVGRPSPLSAGAAPGAAGRRAGAAQARGPEPHRRAQDQQHDRPGAARAADGQAAHHRRDRGGAARRRDRDGVRALRARVRGVHGRRGRAAPGAQRLPHAAAGRDGRAGRVRHAHAQGRDQRGAARLGHQRADDPLHHRLGGRAPIRTRAWCATSSR